MTTPAAMFAKVLLPATQRSVSIPTGLWIGGSWRAASDGGTFDTVNPATGKPLLPVAKATKSDVDAAAKAAREAFRTTWGRNVAPDARARLINKLADLMERDAGLLGELESLNSGKGVRIARDFDVGDSIACLRYYAGYADKNPGETIEIGPGKMAYTTNEPIGVCGQIIPWNYPIMMWAWKVGPALAAGCTIIMKPSELTPLTALYLSTLVEEAGFPAGVVNTLPGLGSEAGQAIAEHHGVDKVAFTGSVVTGRKIMQAAALSNLKKVTLELGGKSPSIIFNTAELEQAASWSAMGVFYNSGQDCCAGTRLYIQSGIYDEFVALLKAKAEACAIGDPSDEATSFGPLISANQRDKVMAYIDSGVAEGATVLTGGKKWDQSEGFYVLPTILVDVKADMKAVREEIFGPVLVVTKFETEDEVLELANDTEYGLGAAVFTSDAKQAMRVSNSLQSGTVWVNQYGILHASVPFGGYKHSGIGRELGSAGIKEYTIVKAVHHNLSEEMSWPV